MKKQKLRKQLYFQVLVAILAGVLLGHLYPKIAILMKPLGDAFIKLIHMMVAPIIFTTVATGIANMTDVKEVGRIGIKALVYFEVVTTLALLIGLVVAELYQPGAGMNIDIHSLNAKAIAIANYSNASKEFGILEYVLNIIPQTMVGAFSGGEILQVLLLAILFGFAILHGGPKLKPLNTLLEQISKALFNIIGFVMKLAPLGAFGSMSYTIAAYGIQSLYGLGHLLFTVYTVSFLFVFLVLGLIAKISGFNLWQFLKYIKEELFIVLGTSSTETVLPRMISKLENMGCGKAVVGLVLPTGYTFNMDGTCIYLTIATLFIAQALNIPLSLEQELFIVCVLLLTSKGAAAVTGGGFIVLAATLSSIHVLPVEGLVLLLGVDRFLSEARALTNLIGNGVATVVIAKWEKDFDPEKAKKAMASEQL